jgi:hypothetical protein
MYDNAPDANRYLANTICYWRGEPVMVSGVDAGYQAIGYKLPYPRGRNPEVIRFDVRDEAFNATDYRLGYINTAEAGAIFATRRPARIQSQGLCGANMSFKQRVGRDVRPRDILRDLVYDAGLRDMLMGRYPTVEEARQKLRDNPNIMSVAFDRLFAIRRHEQFNNLFFLEYRGNDVAHSQEVQFVLPDEFTYLTESCQPKGCLKAA